MLMPQLKMFFRQKKNIFALLFFLCSLGLSTSIYIYRNSLPLIGTPQQSPTDPFLAWTDEVYNIIKTNYWNKVSDGDLAALYQLAAEKVANAPLTLDTKDHAGMVRMMSQALARQKDDAAKRTFVTNVAEVVLYNLQPAGRSGLLGAAQVQALRQTVANIDTSHDLYTMLGVPKDAATSSVEMAYQTKSAALKKLDTPDAQKQLQDLSYAHEVLTNATEKQTYDATRVEPTVFTHIIAPGILYVYISKVSPTTFNEFVTAINNNDSNKSLTSLVIDLRGNIGGAVDFVQYFMGLFIGPGQYAYDFFHQGIYIHHQTPIGKLPALARYRNKTALLVDRDSKSSAELIAATFQRFNTGIVIGTNTNGWGTIENTYPIHTVIDPATSYSLLLVNSLTLRDDGQPIQGNGVSPDVSTEASTWKNDIKKFFDQSAVAAALDAIVSTPPQK